MLKGLKMADVTKGTGGEGFNGQKPVSEHKAIQQLKGFAGDRTRFREWNEKLLNALGHTTHPDHHLLLPLMSEIYAHRLLPLF